nr:MAG TPA: hypothetical protein [Caudoviricetes sp.]
MGKPPVYGRTFRVQLFRFLGHFQGQTVTSGYGRRQALTGALFGGGHSLGPGLFLSGAILFHDGDPRLAFLPCIVGAASVPGKKGHARHKGQRHPFRQAVGQQGKDAPHVLDSRPPACLDIRVLAFVQDQPGVVAIFTEGGFAASGVHVLHGTEPDAVIQPQATGLFAVTVYPAQTAVVGGQGKGHALAVVMSRHTLPEPAVIGDAGTQAPCRIERRGSARFRGDRGQPFGRRRHDLRQSLSTHMGNRVVAPPAFRVDLRREDSHRGIQAPHGAGLADKLIAVLKGRARDLYLSMANIRHEKAECKAKYEPEPGLERADPMRYSVMQGTPRPRKGWQDFPKIHHHSPRQMPSTTAPTMMPRRMVATAKGRKYCSQISKSGLPSSPAASGCCSQSVFK